MWNASHLTCFAFVHNLLINHSYIEKELTFLAEWHKYSYFLSHEIVWVLDV